MVSRGEYVSRSDHASLVQFAASISHSGSALFPSYSKNAHIDWPSISVRARRTGLDVRFTGCDSVTPNNTVWICHGFRGPNVQASTITEEDLPYGKTEERLDSSDAGATASRLFATRRTTRGRRTRWDGNMITSMS